MTDREAAHLESELLYEMEEDRRLRNEVARALHHMGREAKLLKQALLEDNTLLRVSSPGRGRNLLHEVRSLYGAVVRALGCLQAEPRYRGK